MSHWFSVKTKFTSASAIKEAANALGFRTQANGVCRGYDNQKKVCDINVKLPGDYDLGFVKQADGSYVVSADFWANHISDYLGNPALIAAIKEKARLGELEYQEQRELLAEAKMSRFIQEYNRFATRELIEAQGMQYIESKAQDGSYVLEILDYQQDAQIITHVNTDGSLKVEANGYTSYSCEEATKFLKTLGVVSGETQKPEYFDTPLIEGVKHDG